MQIAEPSLSTAAAPLGREHHEIERVRDLELPPCRAAAAGFVEAAGRFRHDPLVTEAERSLEKRLRGGAIARREPRHLEPGWQYRAQAIKPLREGLVDEVLAFGVQAIEHE